MPKVFNRTNTKTAKKTLAIYLAEMKKDKKSIWQYCTLIPINRLLYIVILPLLFSFIIQSLILYPKNWQEPAVLIGIATIVSILSLLTSHFGYKILFLHEERMRTNLT